MNISFFKFGFICILFSGIFFISALNASFAQEYSKNKVYFKGALMNMMRTGDISSKIALSDLKSLKNLYAVGAFENLKGEIQIFDSKPENTIAEKKKFIFDKSFDKNATLLVWASVPKWKTIEIKINSVVQEEIEDLIEVLAAENGVNIYEPFPFLIEGKFNKIGWHIVNWDEKDKVHTHEKHIKSGFNGVVENREAVILGFFSNEHQGIFTHHTSKVHAHFKTFDGELAGHVDSFDINETLILKVPDNN